MRIILESKIHEREKDKEAASLVQSEDDGLLIVSRPAHEPQKSVTSDEGG